MSVTSQPSGATSPLTGTLNPIQVDPRVPLVQTVGIETSKSESALVFVQEFAGLRPRRHKEENADGED